MQAARDALDTLNRNRTKENRMAVEKPTRQTSRQIARSTVIVMIAFGAAKAISLAANVHHRADVRRQQRSGMPSSAPTASPN